MIKVKGEGPLDAKVMIVGESPGAEEVRKNRPFVGPAGRLMDAMIAEVGFHRSNCYITNVCKYRPPDNDLDQFYSDPKHMSGPNTYLAEGIAELANEVRTVQPNIIICFGRHSLKWVTGLTGITKWRGSILVDDHLGHACKVMPTYHPSMIQRDWASRPIAVRDLKRAYAEHKTRSLDWPGVSYKVRPSYEEVCDYLSRLEAQLEKSPTPVAVDLETRKGFIACIGLAWEIRKAICIPLMCVEDKLGYWQEDVEVAIIQRLRRVMLHPNFRLVGQNFAYDSQYFSLQAGFIPRLWADTMLMQNVAFPSLPKSLDFLASMYCEYYCYWKDDGKEWDKSMPEEQLWSYNCEDADRTLECYQVLMRLIEKRNLVEQWQFQTHRLWPQVLRMMLRGHRLNLEYRAELGFELLSEMGAREELLKEILGHPLNPRSSKQMQALFYDDFRQKRIMNRKTKRPSLDADALEEIKRRAPLLRCVVEPIEEYRSLGVYLANFVRAKLDEDKRLRTYFNVAGTETYRFSSSKNAFGGGTNFQNIPRGEEEEEKLGYKLPNIRKMFLPDPGYTYADMDLAGADAQVVAWEAGDPILKQMFREGVKVHAENAKMIFGASAGKDGKKEPYYTRTKIGVHLTNYGGRAKTCAAALNLSVHEGEKFQARWFAIHPWIRQWHDRVAMELQTTRRVSNRFGYTRIYFDRIDKLLPEALAWVPQSTVAHVTNRMLVNIGENVPEALLLLQVHDSLTFQIRTPLLDQTLIKIYPQTQIVIPYEDPLIIPAGLKVSNKSWGECESYAWPK